MSFDITKAKTIVKSTMVIKPNGSFVVENEQRGSFRATFTTTNASASPPDVAGGKGFWIPVQLPGNGTVQIKNCRAYQISRESGVHTDGFYLVCDKSMANLNVIFSDCMADGIDGETFHFEGGSLNRLMFQRCQGINSTAGNKYTIKFQRGAFIKELVFDTCVGSIYFDLSQVAGVPISQIIGKWYVNNHVSGNVPANIGGDGAFAPISGLPAGTTPPTTGGVSPPPPASPPPPPPPPAGPTTLPLPDASAAEARRLVVDSRLYDVYDVSPTAATKLSDQRSIVLNGKKYYIKDVC